MSCPSTIILFTAYIVKVSYSFDQKKVSCLSSYLLLPHKKNHAYVTDSQYSTWLLKKYSRLQYLSHSGHLQTTVKRLTSSFD